MDERKKLALKIPFELDERVEKIASSKGLTKNAYLTMCIADAVNLEEAKLKMISDPQSLEAVTKVFLQSGAISSSDFIGLLGKK